VTSALRILRNAWSHLPERTRAWILRVPGSHAAKQALQRRVPHDEIYTGDYFDGFEQSGIASAPLIAESIVSELHPRTVLDVGCGTGLVLLALRERGVVGRGLEYSAAAIERCRRLGLDVERFDIEHDPPLPAQSFDVVVSLEVGEHMPEDSADRYVDLLCSCGSTIVFSAATPGQGGQDHVNEQPHEYWIRRMHLRGFELDRERSTRWRGAWKAAGAAPWYHQNLMVFVTAAPVPPPL
jgi:SAM-dependent methyltransferase